MAGIYIHIPFCKQACSYCDFYFTTRQKFIDDFVEECLNEIASYQGGTYSGHVVNSIYFGGGTPSLLSPEQISAIIRELKTSFSISGDEITLEANPDDITAKFTTSLREAGINRLSMGVQSFYPEILRFMHRAHSSEEALKSLDIIKKTGFKRFTADLIYGNPGQSIEMLNEDLKTLVSFNPPHISAYSLTIEPQTRLGKQVELGRLQPPDDELTANHYDLVVQYLKEQGYHQYEVSNFALPGNEAMHNSNYWYHENYLGIGPGAHSFWWEEGKPAKALRWTHARDLDAYLKGSWKNKDEVEHLNNRDLAEERIMLGLRTARGISFNTLKEKYDYQFNHEQIQYMKRIQNDGKGILRDTGFGLNSNGMKIADSITLDLIIKKEKGSA